MLRRVAGYVAGLYLLFAVIGRFVEGMVRFAAAARLIAGATAPS